MYVLGEGICCKYCSEPIYEIVQDTWLHQYSDIASCSAQTQATPEEELIDINNSFHQRYGYTHCKCGLKDKK